MDTELAGANGMRPAEGTGTLRQPNATANDHIYLLVLALYRHDHSTFVLGLFTYVYAPYLFLIVVGGVIYLCSPYKAH